jgi:Rrf2 family protein
MLSDTAEYALRATLYIAQHATDGRAVRSDVVAEVLGVPRNYLSKTLHVLAKRGVLTSTRGPLGGFRLAAGAMALPLIRVVEPFDPFDIRRTCILGRPQCSDVAPCPAHDRWKGIGDQVRGFFRDTTIADLLSEHGSLT